MLSKENMQTSRMPPYLTLSKICCSTKTHPSVSGHRAEMTAIITERSNEDLNKVSKQLCSLYRGYSHIWSRLTALQNKSLVKDKL